VIFEALDPEMDDTILI
jgi:hypothetical protein